MKDSRKGLIYSIPLILFLLFCFILPILIITVYSFLSKGFYGGVSNSLSLEGYATLFKPKFVLILGRTLFVSFISTAIIIMLALVVGYAIAKSKRQILYLILIMVPFWTNSLIRIYAWMSILGRNGLVNNILLKIGLIQDSIPLLYNIHAVILVLVYMNLPFAILPIFTSIDKFDFSLLEASRDLGSTKIQSIFKVLIPNIKNGIVTAIIFTLIPIFGAYTVPLLVGGKDSYLIGNVIVDQISKTRNWPSASAFSVVITVISFIAVLIMLNGVYKQKTREIESKTFGGIM